MSTRDNRHSREEKSRRKPVDPYSYEKNMKSGKVKRPDRNHSAMRDDEWDDYVPGEKYIKARQRGKSGRILFWITFVEVVIIVGCVSYLFLSRGNPDVDDLLSKDPKIAYETETEPQPGMAVPKPPIDEQLLTVNDWSRPGTKTGKIEKIVVHYLANPRTTAQENHDYFESLKDLQNVYMSANYVIGLEGEIIQCVPDGEIAWASNEANSYSISIENCHMTMTGKLNKATYWSDVHLVAYLTEKYGLGRDDIIRHYDITGKNCPKWFVEHPDAWEKFKDDVMTYRAECEQAQSEAISEAIAAGIPEEDVLAVYLSENVYNDEDEIRSTEQDLWDVLKKKTEILDETKADEADYAEETIPADTPLPEETAGSTESAADVPAPADAEQPLR